MNVVFAGSFDPISKGHYNIIKRLSKKFDKVFVVIGKNPNKTCLFSFEDRKELLSIALKDIKNAYIYEFIDEKSYREFLDNNNIRIYARGIRNDIDFAYEKAYEEKNKGLYNNIKTIYIKADKRLEKVSSNAIRNNILKGEKIDKLALNCTIREIEKIIKNRK